MVSFMGSFNVDGALLVVERPDWSFPGAFAPSGPPPRPAILVTGLDAGKGRTSVHT
jgi:hypothetical protein